MFRSGVDAKHGTDNYMAMSGSTFYCTGPLILTEYMTKSVNTMVVITLMPAVTAAAPVYSSCTA